MAIATSNKPASKKTTKKKAAPTKKAAKPVPTAADKAAAEEAKKKHQAAVKEAIRATKEELDVTEKEAIKVEKMKVNVLWTAGERITKLAEGLSGRENANLIGLFHKETGYDDTFFYLAKQVVANFSPAQYDQVRKAGLTVRVVKALTSLKNKDEALFDKAFKGALEDGWDDARIRSVAGTKGTRSVSAAKNTRTSNNNKPPIRVFTKGIDQSLAIGVTLASCSDAVARLPKVKTDKERSDSIKELLKLRKQAEKMKEEIESFLKFTSTFDKK